MKSKDQLILENIYTSAILNEDNLLNPDELIDFLVDWNHLDYNKELSNDEKNLFKKWVSRDIKRKVAAETTCFRHYNKRMGGPKWYSTVKDSKIFKIPVQTIDEGDYLTYTLGNLVSGAMRYYKMVNEKEKSKVLKITLQDAIERYKKMFEGKPKENVDYKVVMRFDDGFKIVKLLSKTGYTYHGVGASNCVSPELFKTAEIYGLWNPNNKVKATIGLQPKTNKINELASFSKKYTAYLFEFIKTNNLVPHRGSSDETIIGEDEVFNNFPKYTEYLASKGINR